MNKKQPEEKMNFTDARKIFQHYFSILKQYRLWFWLTLLFYGVGTLFSEIVAVVLFKEIIDALSAGQTAGIWQLFIYLGGTYVTFFVLFRLGDIAMSRYEVPSMTALSRYAFSEIQKHSYDFFTDRFVGSLTSQIKRYVDALIRLFEGLVFTYWMNLITLLGIFATMFVFSWKLAILFVFNSIIIFSVAIPLLRRRMEYDELGGKASSEVSGQFSDVITNIMNVKLFTGFHLEKELFHAITEKYADIEKKSWHVWILTIALQNGLMLLSRYGIFGVALYLWSQGEVTTGTVVLVVGFTQSLFSILWQVTRSTSGMLKDIASAKEMIDQLNEPVTLFDMPGAKKLEMKSGAILFEDIAFSYKDGGVVFENFSVDIKPGEKIGIVGPSGGGKSTFTKLLLRFMDPTLGKVCIDGQNIKEVTQGSLHQAIGYVPQDPILFHRTLKENIAYGKEGASQDEILEAAKKAHAHEFIETLENGYDTMVGERGVKLSGGQRQRIAIARAILKNAPILVLDEATSALDSISELAIREAVDELIQNKTAIIIAHRLSTVEKMDRIIVLGKDGKISEQGTHQELVSKGGLYSELWSHQTGGFLPDDEDKPKEGAETLET